MKKEELMKLDGMTEELAAKVAEMSANETKDMVPRSRLNEVIADRDHAKQDHADVLKQLNDLKKDASDLDSLKEQIQNLQNTAKETQKAHDAEIKQLKINNAVESALNGAKAKNLKAVKALLNMEGAELMEDGTVKGLAEQIKKLTEADDSKFLFGSSEASKPSGANPAANPAGGTPETITKAQFNRMSYKEKVDLYNTNQELFNSLSSSK